jgi:hypothetical protein
MTLSAWCNRKGARRKLGIFSGLFVHVLVNYHINRVASSKYHKEWGRKLLKVMFSYSDVLMNIDTGKSEVDVR